MAKYLETIHKVNLLPFLSSKLDDLESQFWLKIIAQNNKFRARYFFNDIVAFQAIPKIAIWFVMRRKWEQAIEFIDRMLDNAYLSDYLKSIPIDTGVNYYEQAAYTALALGYSTASAFLLLVQNKPEFNINRLYHCVPIGIRFDFQNTIDSAPGVIKPTESVDEAQCERFVAQLNRVADITLSGIEILTECV
ncbi:hypothetical protein H4R34_005683 [Dimargaris verticillata]|uniref:Uncharacterized protein n=1 Tax=Dimargaris verticillata TaxID=2761393 RepID=A0A9W8B1S7_9FUNG|nr:hypothetical protein H4R34_005683 [Dimargaris verticillata]